MISADRAQARAALYASLTLLTLLGLAATLTRRQAPAPPALEVRGRSMGTTYAVKIAGTTSAADAARVRTIVETELDRVERAMSTYDADSELTHFNRHASTDPFDVSPPTLDVFTLARQVSEMTDGAFDVTVGPLVAAWGFGATDRIPAPPSDDDLRAARLRVGFRLIDINEDAATLVKHRIDVVSDLSAIAKGYAVDRAVEALLGSGYRDVLVEVGGDLRVAGRRPDGGPWRVAIERPRPERGRVQRMITLADHALATSGDYRNYYQSRGQRVSHLVDPRTGLPTAGDLASVSVVHQSAATADALATALSVLGADEGIRFAEQQNLAALFLVRQQGSIRELPTRAFTALQSTAAVGPEATRQSSVPQ